MQIRDLVQNETEKLAQFAAFKLPYSYLYLTETGLNKGILDATRSITELFFDSDTHDYGTQQQGEAHKKELPSIVASEGLFTEVNVSLYRPNTKTGDHRFWPSRFSQYAEQNQVFAISICNGIILFLNLSDGQPFNCEDMEHINEMARDLGVNKEQPVIDTSVEEGGSTDDDESTRFEVSSYGWDSDVEGLVKRINRGDIQLPGFQRGFVWTTTEQSSFIESLILGLPVPNIFLAKDSESKKLNIIDGQQRLKTLQRYLGGHFPLSNSKKIHEELRGQYFSKEVAKTATSKVLSEEDARVLSDSIIHSIVIRPDAALSSQEYGSEYNDAVIQIFRRLNTSGKPLQAQEVRSCIFYGAFDDLLHNLNNINSWRSLFGPEHSRNKDIEAILRFLSLFENFQNYTAPMPSFLDRFMENNRNADADKLAEMGAIFQATCDHLLQACGESLFRAKGTFLLSKFDAVAVGCANAIQANITLTEGDILANVESLLSDSDYLASTANFINDVDNVQTRINVATRIFTSLTP